MTSEPLEPLYRLPNGDWITLSDVKGIRTGGRPSFHGEEPGDPCVYVDLVAHCVIIACTSFEVADEVRDRLAQYRNELCVSPANVTVTVTDEMIEAGHRAAAYDDGPSIVQDWPAAITRIYRAMRVVEAIR